MWLLVSPDYLRGRLVTEAFEGGCRVWLVAVWVGSFFTFAALNCLSRHFGLISPINFASLFFFSDQLNSLVSLVLLVCLVCLVLLVSLISLISSASLISSVSVLTSLSSRVSRVSLPRQLRSSQQSSQSHQVCHIKFIALSLQSH